MSEKQHRDSVSQIAFVGTSRAQCLVVLSGGADSTICAAWAKSKYDVVHAVTFNYGQRHITELESAIAVAKELNLASHEILDLGADILKSTSPLVSGNKVEQYESADDLPSSVASTFVPSRNQLFLTIASNRAIALNIHTVVTGVCQTDYSGYYDCRREFIDALETVISLGNYGLSAGFGIETPLMNLTKAASILMAYELLGDRFEAVMEHTHTCYQGVKGGCGKCAACLLRDKGFKEAGIEDPIWKYRQNAHSLC